MQRRRKPKSEPRNIFDKTAGGKPPKTTPKPRHSSQAKPPRNAKPTLPPSIPTPKPETKPEPNPVELDTPALESEADFTAEQESVLEEQLLGASKRQTRGLSQTKNEPQKEEGNVSTSTKAMEIIEASKARASAMVEVKSKQPAVVAPPPKRPRPSRRSATKFQPATREKRLDRSRHMEYKYEMRSLLKEIDVAEEHHSSILSSIWAKGERQTTEEARQFILAKQNEGILNDEQVTNLMAIVDDYTIRR